MKNHFFTRPFIHMYKIKKGLSFSAKTLLSSAISFRLPPDSIPAAASFRFTSVFTLSLPTFSRLSIPRFAPLPVHFLTPSVLAFFRPPQFWVLTTQPLFLPFLFLPASASQWLPRCSLSAFASWVFPVPSDLISHVFSPGSLYSASCSFPFALP